MNQTLGLKVDLGPEHTYLYDLIKAMDLLDFLTLILVKYFHVRTTLLILSRNLRFLWNRPVDNNDDDNDNDDDYVDNNKYPLVYPLPIESRGSLPTVFDLDLILIFHEIQIKIYMPFSAYILCIFKDEIANNTME